MNMRDVGGGHVVHVIESFSGGSAQVVLALTKMKSLPGGMPISHTVIHGWRDNSSEDFLAEFDAGVRLIRLPGFAREISPLRDILVTARLIAILVWLPELHVLHLHSSKAGAVGRLAALLTGRRRLTIYTAHGVSMLRHDISTRARRLYSFIERVAAWGGREVVACSPSEQEVFTEIGVAARVIPNGIPDIGLSPPSILCRPLRVVGVGRLSAQKDPAFFFELAGRAHARGLACEFVWVGDGELRGDICVDGAVVTGWLSQEGVCARLREADIFLSTSLWEGLSLAALQAMSAGLPLLLRRCPGNVDLLGEEGFSHGFDSAEDVLSWLEGAIAKPQMIRDMGRASRLVFEQRYTERAMCAAYAALYAEVIGNE